MDKNKLYQAQLYIKQNHVTDEALISSLMRSYRSRGLSTTQAAAKAVTELKTLKDIWS